MTYVTSEIQRRNRVFRELKRYSWLAYRKIWQIAHNYHRESVPVFIVGSGRAGTDLLLGHLSWSLSVQTYNEANKRAFKNWRLRPLEEIELLIQKSFARTVLFKPIVETYRAAELLRKFDGAKVVFIARHYADAIESIARFFENLQSTLEIWAESAMNDPLPPNVSTSTRRMFDRLYRKNLSQKEAAALYWIVYNNSYSALNLRKNKCVLLTFYEDLVQSTQEEFERVCNFIGAPYSSRMKRGIVTTSIRKRDNLELRDEIQEQCEDVWQRLIMQRTR